VRGRGSGRKTSRSAFDVSAPLYTSGIVEAGPTLRPPPVLNVQASLQRPDNGNYSRQPTSYSNMQIEETVFHCEVKEQIRA